MHARRRTSGRPTQTLTVLATVSAVLVAPLASVAVAAVPSPRALGAPFFGPAAAPVLAGGRLLDPTAEGLAVAPTTPEVTEFSVAEELAAKQQRILSGRLARTGGTADGARSGSAPDTRTLMVTAKPREVSGYGVVGVTWDGLCPVDTLFTVRTRTGAAAWSDWQTVHGGGCPCAACAERRAVAVSSHGPNLGSPELDTSRPGTDALAVGDVDEVQLRVTTETGELPEDLELAVIDPEPTVTAPVAAAATAGGARTGSSEPSPETFLAAASPETAAAAADDNDAARTATTDGRAGRPTILSRAAWGADERLRSGSPSYGVVRAGFVHHTVNANAYTREQVPSILRGIYAYHTQSRGWSDVGYNFLVDRFGRIWEGRYGGVDRAVIGAHTLGYNHLAFAMSAIGNFDIAQPPAEMVESYADLMAWKLDLHGVAADSTTTLDGDRFQAINGHRDAGSTACPGRYLYAKLPAIRSRAAAIQDAADDGGATPPPVEPVPRGKDLDRDLDDDGRADLVVRDRRSGRLLVLNGEAGPGFAARSELAIPAGMLDLVSGVGDVTGDGRPDMLTRVRATGLTQLRPGRDDGGFARPVRAALTDAFADADLLAGAGDLSGTRFPDVVSRDKATGRLWLHRGRSEGRWGRRLLLLADARGLSDVGAAGDLDGDGRADLLARRGDQLLLLPGVEGGTLGAAVVVSERWGGRDLTVAGQDVTGDGVDDVLSRDRTSGRTWVYALDAQGRPGPRSGGWTGWQDLVALTAVGPTGARPTRLVGTTTTGQQVALDARGTGWFARGVPTVARIPGADLAQVTTDWDGDGLPDVLTRSTTTGNLMLHAGTDDGALAERTRLFGSWSERSDLAVTPDLTGDAQPDLVARDDADGALYAYPGDGGGGAGERRLVRSGLFDTDLVTAVGYWNGDAVRDLVVRRTSTGRLFLLPGTTAGSLGAPVRLSNDVSRYDQVAGVGDLDGDDRPDLVAVERATGRLWLLRGSADGLAPRRYLAGGLGRFDLLG